MRQLKHAFLRQIDWIKRKTAFRIKALETALTEVKLKKQVFINRIEMEREDAAAEDYNEMWNTGPPEQVQHIEIARKRILRLNRHKIALNKKVEMLKRESEGHEARIAEERVKTEAKEAEVVKLEERLKDLRKALTRVLEGASLYKSAAI